MCHAVAVGAQDDKVSAGVQNAFLGACCQISERRYVVGFYVPMSCVSIGVPEIESTCLTRVSVMTLSIIG